MAHDVIIIPRPLPSRKTGVASPQHETRTATPPIVEGDPFYRHVIRDSDFYMIGKIRHLPGTHHNIYTAIPYLQSIQERFMGLVRRRRTPHLITTPRGEQHGKFAGDVNVEVPEASTYGSFATYSGEYRERIRNGRPPY